MFDQGRRHKKPPPEGPSTDPTNIPHEHIDVTLYGPSGLRRFIRSALGAIVRLPSTAPPLPTNNSAGGV